MAGKEDRNLNFLIDMVLILIISSVFVGLSALLFQSVTSSDNPITYFIFFLAYFTYYTSFELILSQTPGKILTNTRVVKKNNKEICLKDALLRTLVRLTGLDLYSYLFGTELGMHDQLTNTKVIKDTQNKMIKKPN